MTTIEHAPLAHTVIYSEGLFFASVCSSLSQAEVEAWMARKPCGTTNGWTLADEPFRSGKPNPCLCNHDASRQHWLFAA